MSKLDLPTAKAVLKMCHSSRFPSTVETFLCIDEHISGDRSAHAIERGSHGQIKRKEVRSVSCAHNLTIQTKHSQIWHQEYYLDPYAWVLVRSF